MTLYDFSDFINGPGCNFREWILEMEKEQIPKTTDFAWRAATITVNIDLPKVEGLVSIGNKVMFFVI